MEQWREDLYLAHYGILGMKWGVRRYQKYDGGYTRLGLARYKNAEKDYQNKYANLLSSRTSKNRNKSQIKSNRKSTKAARKELNKAYKDLKKANLADQGHRLYDKGNKITLNTISKSKAAQTAITAGAIIVPAVLRNKGIIKTRSATKTMRRAMFIGGTAINAAIKGSRDYKNKRLMAYHERMADENKRYLYYD